MSDVINASPPREKRTLVEEGTEFEGTLTSRCPIDVMGKVKGDVSGPSIHISATGTLDGTVKVKELCSEGELAGSVDADIVQLSGRVRDNTVIRASAVEVRLGRSDGKMQIVFGDCQLEVGAQPDKEAAIAAALSSDRNAAAAAAVPLEQPAATVSSAPSAAAAVPPATAPAATVPAVTAPAPTASAAITRPAATMPAFTPPAATAPPAPRVGVGSQPGRADEPGIEAKGLPAPEAWDVPQESGADAGPADSAAAEDVGDRSGNGQNRRERRRRGTLPPPPG
jgi:cytoskeletal protein CcmA (bactofilin family)